jgi:hypothetical protein
VNIPVVDVVRLEECFYHGTFGVMRIQSQVFCATLEPRDELNARNISCIPAQQYVCARFSSNRYGQTFRVEDVPERTGILFHAGNVAEHTEGCILLGRGWDSLGQERRGIVNSAAVFKEFMEIMKPFERFILNVTWCL